MILGCANQAGEDNPNVARMVTLLAGFPVEISVDEHPRPDSSAEKLAALRAAFPFPPREKCCGGPDSPSIRSI